MVKACGAERGFVLLDRAGIETDAERGSPPRRVWAVDMDGFALGHGGQRLPLELLPREMGEPHRRVGEGAGLSLSMSTGLGTLTLVMEHRFRRYPLDHLTDDDLSNWLLALSVGLRWALDDSLDAPSKEAEAHADDPPRATSEPGRRGSVSPTDPKLERKTADPAGAAAAPPSQPGIRKARPQAAPQTAEAKVTHQALEATSWNISQAARILGITRHGLKKRMRRLGLERRAEA